MDRYRVEPGAKVDLDAWDPNDKGDFQGRKADAKALRDQLSARLGEAQELLYAEGRHRLLVVLQGMDTAGKDSTIRMVFEDANPQGVEVTSFKKPTEHELARDYLWRVHREVPRDGMIGIFNRSHYEDVLVVRVRELVPQARWEKRYRHIVEFERMLADEGTTILKFFLHISRDEQKERLQSRLDEPHKQWKFKKGDLEERGLWDAYQAAYREALERTSTEHAPWYVVPANSKWYRNLVVSSVLVESLEGLGMQWPEAEEGLEDVVIV